MRPQQLEELKIKDISRRRDDVNFTDFGVHSITNIKKRA